MKKVRITKLTDDVFNGNHPNNINVGYIREGMSASKPVINERYFVGWDWATSNVISFDEENSIIKTENSTYKIEYLD